MTTKHAMCIPVSRDLCGDGIYFQARQVAMEKEVIYRVFLPWSLPDTNPFPKIRLFRWLPNGTR